MGSKALIWLTIISLIFALAVAVTNLWDWVMSPDPNLVAEIEYGLFEYPPGLIDSLKSLRNLADESRLMEIELEDALKPIPDSMRESSRHWILLYFSLYLKEHLPSGVPQPFSDIRGYWSITLRNEGEKLARSVMLRLHNLVYVCIYRDGEALVSNESPESIKIGDLHPLEEIRIIAWSSGEPSFYRYRYDEIRLTHESGVGTVLIRAPIDPVWHKLASFWEILWSTIQFFIIAVLILVAIAWIVAKLEERKRSQPNSSESQSKPDPN